MKRDGTGMARRLRRIPTEAEKCFWNAVRNRQINGAKFRRQWPIDKYIVDFVCVEARLVVEIDGGQHADSERDLARTKALTVAGYRVIRFWNNEVLDNLSGVLESLGLALAD